MTSSPHTGEVESIQHLTSKGVKINTNGYIFFICCRDYGIWCPSWTRRTHIHGKEWKSFGCTMLQISVMAGMAGCTASMQPLVCQRPFLALLERLCSHSKSKFFPHWKTCKALHLYYSLCMYLHCVELFRSQSWKANAASCNKASHVVLHKFVNSGSILQLMEMDVNQSEGDELHLPAL